MKNLLVIEDDADLRELIILTLSRRGYNIGGTVNAQDALVLLEDAHYDLILLDLMLPGLKGLDFLRIVKEKHDTTGIIIVSALNREEEIVKGLDAGADDYICKPFGLDVLRARVDALLRRKRTPEQKNADMKMHNAIRINLLSRQVKVDDASVALTSKEFDLLHYMIENRGQALTRNRLLDAIWGYDAMLETRTVDSHIASLRKKLGNAGKEIKSIHKIGYGIGIE